MRNEILVQPEPLKMAHVEKTRTVTVRAALPSVHFTTRKLSSVSMEYKFHRVDIRQEQETME